MGAEMIQEVVRCKSWLPAREAIYEVLNQEHDRINEIQGCDVVAAVALTLSKLGRYRIRRSIETDIRFLWPRWTVFRLPPAPFEVLHDADKALRKVLLENSELYQSWLATEYFEDWKSSVEDLIVRLPK